MNRNRRLKQAVRIVTMFTAGAVQLALGCSDMVLDSGVDLPDMETAPEDSAPDTETGTTSDSDSEGTGDTDTGEGDTDSAAPDRCPGGGQVVATIGSDACWYLGTDNQSCTEICAPHGGLHPDNAAVIGSAAEGGSSYNCGRILYGFSLLGYIWEIEAPITNQGLGCYRFYDWTLNAESNFWISGVPFAPDEAAMNIKRVCGCMGETNGG